MSIKLYHPQWGSRLTGTIIELERLREEKLMGTVPPYIFFQLKEIFHMLESLGSARIEGNHTTLAELVEQVIENKPKESQDEKMTEIHNIDRAIKFLESFVDETTHFDRAFFSELHKILMEGLKPAPAGEGSRFPGILRPVNVSIQGSGHKPPDHVKVPEYFQELMDFVNQPMETQFHLLAIALSHHQMAWIHPFDNGNGRLVRLFTYAFLIKQGFQVKRGGILNPTAVFCMDRNKYYEMLALADTQEEEKVLEWCLFVLDGLRIEIEKIDRLLDLNYTVSTILIPMLNDALDRQHLTQVEFDILVKIVKSEDMQIKSADLEAVIGKESSVQRSRILRRLKDKGMIRPIKDGGRIYTIGFSNNYLLRDIMKVLEKNSFIPSSLNSN